MNSLPFNEFTLDGPVPIAYHRRLRRSWRDRMPSKGVTLGFFLCTMFGFVLGAYVRSRGSRAAQCESTRKDFPDHLRAENITS